LKREALNWDPKTVFVDNRYISPDTIVYLPSINQGPNEATLRVLFGRMDAEQTLRPAK